MAAWGSESDRRKGGVAGGPGDAGQTWRACGEPIQVVGNPMFTFLCLWALGLGEWKNEKSMSGASLRG